MEHAYRWCSFCFWCYFMACIVSPEVRGADRQDSSEAYSHRLYTPTQITKIKDNYFIVDCWHHRIIYSNSLSTPISAWQVLDDDIAGPHSIASDGKIYVAEDTGRNRLKVYKETDDGEFRQIQLISDVGKRPHRVLYAEGLRRFLVIGSGNQVLYTYEPKNGQLSQSGSQHIDELHGQYTRSITLVDDSIYFVGSEDIVRFRISTAGMQLMDNFTLASPYRGSNDLIFIGTRSGVFTATPQRAVVFDDLSQLSGGTANDISDLMAGTPYYGSIFDGYFWMPEITEYSRIVKYPMTGTGVRFDRGEIVFDFGPPNEASKRRRAILPL